MKYIVGDWVIINKDRPLHAELKKGDIVQISTIDDVSIYVINDKWVLREYHISPADDYILKEIWKEV